MTVFYHNNLWSTSTLFTIHFQQEVGGLFILGEAADAAGFDLGNIPGLEAALGVQGEGQKDDPLLPVHLCSLFQSGEGVCLSHIGRLQCTVQPICGYPAGHLHRNTIIKLGPASGNGDGDQLTPPVPIPLPLARRPALLQALVGPQLPLEGASSHIVGKIHLIEMALQLAGRLGHGGFPVCHDYRADHRLTLGQKLGVVPNPDIAQTRQDRQEQGGRQNEQPSPPSDFRSQLGQSEPQGIPDGFLPGLFPPLARKQLSDGEAQGLGQGLQQADVGTAQARFP